MRVRGMFKGHSYQKLCPTFTYVLEERMLPRGKELSNTLKIPLFQGFEFIKANGGVLTGGICLTTTGVWYLYSHAFMSEDTLKDHLKALAIGEEKIKYPSTHIVKPQYLPKNG